jgi:glycosyltransferase involved in cell wall biosynthesis
MITMKVMILVRILWTAGAPKKALRQAKALTQLGHEVQVVFLRRSSRIPGYVDLMEGVNAVVLQERNESPLVPLFDLVTGTFMPDRAGDGRIDYNLIRQFPTYVSRHQPDLLICHDQYAGLAGYYVWRRLGVPYSVLMHERVDWKRTTPGHKLVDLFEHRTLAHAVSVIASTEKIAETVRFKHHLPVIANYQGLDLSAFRDFTQKENNLAAVSTWDSGRSPARYLDLIDALPDYTLLMAGNWRSDLELAKFREEVKKRPSRTRVRILTGVSEDQLNEVYDSSKFSVRFGFGEFGESHAVFESLQRGVPVVINDDLGTAGLVREAKVGFVTSGIDVPALVEFIRMADNPIIYHTFQENIRAIARKYTWAAHAQNLLSSLNQ